MRIGVDLDGVGYVFGQAVRDYLVTQDIEVEEPVDEFCKHWNFYEFWHMTREDFSKHCDAGVDAGIIFGPGDHLTRPGFFESIKKIKNLGHEVIVLTHRFQGSPGKAQENTELWLAPVREYIDEVHYTEDKTSVYTDMFVEDNLKNYDALIAAGTDAFLINRPWNIVEGGDDRMRIRDVEEFAWYVHQETISQRARANADLMYRQKARLQN